MRCVESDVSQGVYTILWQSTVDNLQYAVLTTSWYGLDAVYPEDEGADVFDSAAISTPSGAPTAASPVPAQRKSLFGLGGCV